MSKKILFSPVGNSDPKGKRDGKDTGFGPLVSILKAKKFDLVYLFLSIDMQENEKNDQRYTEAVKEFGYSEVHLIEYNNDAVDETKLYTAFKKELRAIQDNHPDSRIFVNTNSGTPQMGNTLKFLYLLENFDNLTLLSAKMPQIPSPDSYSTVSELDTFGIGTVLEEESIKQMLERYDFDGAWKKSEKLANVHCFDPEIAKQIEKLAFKYRLMGDYPNNIDSIKAYLDMLQVKLKRSDYAEFTIMLTPIITEIAKYLLRTNGLQDDKWTTKDEFGSLIFNQEKIEKDTALAGLLGEMFDENGKLGKYVYNEHLIKLLKHYCPRAVTPICDAENFTKKDNVRNLIAHTAKFVEIDKDEAKRVFKGLCNLMSHNPNYFEVKVNEIIEDLNK